jgi:hypothetical protein
LLSLQGLRVWGVGLLLGFREGDAQPLLLNASATFARLLPTLTFGSRDDDWVYASSMMARDAEAQQLVAERVIWLQIERSRPTLPAALHRTTLPNSLQADSTLTTSLTCCTLAAETVVSTVHLSTNRADGADGASCTAQGGPDPGGLAPGGWRDAGGLAPAALAERVEAPGGLAGGLASSGLAGGLARPDGVRPGGLAAEVERAAEAGLLTPYVSILSPRVRECVARCTRDGARAAERPAYTSEERLERVAALWADVLGM